MTTDELKLLLLALVLGIPAGFYLGSIAPIVEVSIETCDDSKIQVICEVVEE